MAELLQNKVEFSCIAFFQCVDVTFDEIFITTHQLIAIEWKCVVVEYWSDFLTKDALCSLLCVAF